MQKKNQKQSQLDRRDFLKKSTGLVAGLPFLSLLGGCSDYFIENLTINEFHDLLSTHFWIEPHWYSSSDQLTVERHTDLCIQHINNHNHKLKAVIEINPDALDFARELDAKYRETRQFVGPLHGVPILVKDSIHTKDKMNSSAGTHALRGVLVEEEAHVVKMLRQAGAVILGKTNLSELNGIRAFGLNSVGWSSVGGKTRNIFAGRDTDLGKTAADSELRFAGGSSSGSAVATAVGFSIASLGTDTHSSSITPALKASLVAIRPSRAVLDTDRMNDGNVVPILNHQDVICPIAKTVEDAAIVLGVMQSSLVDTSYAMPTYRNYSDRLKIDGLKGKKFAIFPNDAPDFNESGVMTDKQLETLITILQEEGADVVKLDIKTSLKADFRRFEDLFFNPETNGVFYAYAKRDLNNYLFKRAQYHKIYHPYSNVVSSISDLLTFNRTHQEALWTNSQGEVSSNFNAEPSLVPDNWLELINQAPDANTPEFSDLQWSYHRLLDEIHDKIAKEAPDRIWLGRLFCAQELNLPMITIPYGNNPTNNLPSGIVMQHPTVGPDGLGELIEVGYALEQTLKKRRLGRRTPGWY